MSTDARDLMDDFSVAEEGYSMAPDAVRQRQWRAANLERARLRNRIRQANYRARQLGARGTITLAQWVMLCGLYGNRCLSCGQSHDLEIDHIVPLEKGGTNTSDNLQPLCAPCNKKKGRSIENFRGGGKQSKPSKDSSYL